MLNLFIAITFGLLVLVVALVAYIYTVRRIPGAQPGEELIERVLTGVRDELARHQSTSIEVVLPPPPPAEPPPSEPRAP